MDTPQPDQEIEARIGEIVRQVGNRIPTPEEQAEALARQWRVEATLQRMATQRALAEQRMKAGPTVYGGEAA